MARSLREWLQWAGQQLPASATPKLDAEVLLAWVLERSRTYLIAHADEPLTPDQAGAFKALIKARRAGQPVAYLTGEKGFWSLSLKVTEATLIPRPETETLVEWVLEHFPPQPARRLLDLGTGTGALALAIASERPAWSITATDRYAETLAVAEANARANNVMNVTFQQGDWFDAIDGGRFDIIVSNPPYVAEADPHLDQQDVCYEPRHALVAGQDGLDDMGCIIDQAGGYLVHGGVLMLEHGCDQASSVQALLAGAGFQKVSTLYDLAQLPRASVGYWPGPE